MNNIPRIPLGEWVDSFVASLYEHLEAYSEDSLILSVDSLIYSLIF